MILYLSASPADTPGLASGQECSVLESQVHGVFEFRSKWGVTIDDMVRHLDELQPDVIHFSMHGSRGTTDVRAVTRDVALASPGTSAAVTTSGAMCLQDKQGHLHSVPAEAMAKVIQSTARSVKLVVLNACYSDAQAKVLRHVADCTVGMSGAITDVAALAFSVAFYRALASGNSVFNAMEQAVAVLAAKQMSYEGSPRCYTRDGIDARKVVLCGR